MTGSLRHIALTVEEAGRGQYHWQLIESQGDAQYQPVQRSPVSYASYLRALQAGFEHLALLSASGLHERRRQPREPKLAFPPIESTELDHAI